MAAMADDEIDPRIEEAAFHLSVHIRRYLTIRDDGVPILELENARTIVRAIKHVLES
jgi:hypothetical protein